MSRRYLVRRLLLVIPVLLGVMLLVFGMVFLAPGDPIQRLAGNKPLAPSTVAAIKASYHLDRPFFVQFLLYTKGVLHGDFGETFTGRSVSEIVKERFPVTLRLALGSFGVEVVVGLTLAIVAAVKRRTWIDSTILAATLVLLDDPDPGARLRLPVRVRHQARMVPGRGQPGRMDVATSCRRSRSASARRRRWAGWGVRTSSTTWARNTSGRRTRGVFLGVASSATTC